MNTKQKKKVRIELKMTKCRYCKATEDLSIDHKHPLVAGGTNEKKNLQCLCEPCNKLKSNIPDKVFRRIMRHGIKCGVIWGLVTEIKK